MPWREVPQVALDRIFVVGGLVYVDNRICSDGLEQPLSEVWAELPARAAPSKQLATADKARPSELLGRFPWLSGSLDQRGCLSDSQLKGLSSQGQDSQEFQGFGDMDYEQLFLELQKAREDIDEGVPGTTVPDDFQVKLLGGSWSPGGMAAFDANQSHANPGVPEYGQFSY